MAPPLDNTFITTQRTTKKRSTYTAGLRVDAETQDRLYWINAAIKQLMPGSKTSNSTLIRRAIAVYAEHLEHIMGSTGEAKPRLLQREGCAINHHRNEHRSPHKEGKLLEAALFDDAGIFKPYGRIVKDAIKAGPSVMERLEKEFPPSNFSQM